MRPYLPLIALLLIFAGCQEVVVQEADEKLALAETALHEENWELANGSFHEAILLDPERADAWIGRGMALTQLGETDEARLHYEEALAILEARPHQDPPTFDHVRRTIMLLVLLGRNEEARGLAVQTATEHPDQENAVALPQLVDRLNHEFRELILPAPTDDEPQFAKPFEEPAEW